MMYLKKFSNFITNPPFLFFNWHDDVTPNPPEERKPLATSNVSRRRLSYFYVFAKYLEIHFFLKKTKLN